MMAVITAAPTEKAQYVPNKLKPMPPKVPMTRVLE